MPIIVPKEKKKKKSHNSQLFLAGKSFGRFKQVGYYVCYLPVTFLHEINCAIEQEQQQTQLKYQPQLG